MPVLSVEKSECQNTRSLSESDESSSTGSEKKSFGDSSDYKSCCDDDDDEVTIQENPDYVIGCATEQDTNSDIYNNIIIDEIVVDVVSGFMFFSLKRNDGTQKESASEKSRPVIYYALIRNFKDKANEQDISVSESITATDSSSDENSSDSTAIDSNSSYSDTSGCSYKNLGIDLRYSALLQRALDEVMSQKQIGTNNEYVHNAGMQREVSQVTGVASSRYINYINQRQKVEQLATKKCRSLRISHKSSSDSKSTSEDEDDAKPKSSTSSAEFSVERPAYTFLTQTPVDQSSVNYKSAMKLSSNELDVISEPNQVQYTVSSNTSVVQELAQDKEDLSQSVKFERLKKVEESMLSMKLRIGAVKPTKIHCGICEQWVNRNYIGWHLSTARHRTFSMPDQVFSMDI